MPAAVIEIVNNDTNVGKLLETNGDGLYFASSLIPGNYRMIITKQGFKQIIQANLALHTQDELTLNFALQVGSASETVTVSSAAGMVPISDSPGVGLLVNRDFVEDTPLNGRSFQDLIALTPGTQTSQSAAGGYFSVNGQREDANNYMVDGVAANVGSSAPFTNSSPFQTVSGSYPAATAVGTTQTLASVDAMQEFRIQTSGYTAEYGRQPGGQVQITTRSGTAQFHGTAFDYLRNTVFDANNWFANAAGQPRVPEHQNDFGGTFGGPLKLGGIGPDGQDTFFFFSYEGLRLLLPAFISDLEVPTAAFRRSAAPGVQPFLNAWPIPSGPTNPDGISAPFSAGYDQKNSLDAISVRVDHKFNDNLAVFFRFGDSPSSVDRRGAPANVLNAIEVNAITATIGATWLMRPAIVNELRFNYSGVDSPSVFEQDSFGGATPLALSLIVPDPYQKLPGGYESAGQICPSGSALCLGYVYNAVPSSKQKQINFVDSLSWTIASHTLKFGGDYRRLTPLSGFGRAQYTTAFNLGSLADIQTGTADYLLVLSKAAAYPVFDNLSIFAQDHWKIGSRLTLDYGVRWELDPAPGVRKGLPPIALTSSDIATAQIAPLGTAVYKTTYTNFAPRLGLAWQATTWHTHPIVIRAGSGIFYDTGQNLATIPFTGTVPYLSFNFFTSAPVPFASGQLVPPPLVTLTPPYSRISVSDPNLKLPYTAQWNLSVDVGLASRNTLTMSYVGNVGRRQLLPLYYYQGFPNPQFVPGGLDLLTTNAGASNYNALQIVDQGFVAPGLQLIASYSYAHAIDNVSSDFDAGVNPNPIWGNSDNDVRNSFNLAANYMIPGVARVGSWKQITHGWTASTRFVAQSGYPFDIVQGQIFLSDGTLINIHPDLIPSVPVYLHGVPGVPGGWRLNPAAFMDVPIDSSGNPIRQGTLGRNLIHGPAFWNLNTAIQRQFPIHENLNLLFRVEAFNILNHPNFTSIQSYLPAPNFGEATSITNIGVPNPLYATGSPRSLQLSLKLQF